MNLKLYKLAVLSLLCLSAKAASGQVYTANIVGYVNTVFRPGNNLFENPLVSTADTLSNLFSAVNVPNGSTVSLWNATTSTFSTTSEYSGGAWSVDLTLEPGTGAELNTPSSFTNTFVGYVLDHNGTILQSQQLTIPPIFSGSNGTYLFGDVAPTVDTGTDIFLNILGRLPNPGEQVTLLDNASQTYITSTYLGNGNWDNIPTLGVGQAAFLNVQSAPEPGVLSLLGVGAMLVLWRMKRSDQSPKFGVVSVGACVGGVYSAYDRKWRKAGKVFQPRRADDFKNVRENPNDSPQPNAG